MQQRRHSTALEGSGLWNSTWTSRESTRPALHQCPHNRSSTFDAFPSTTDNAIGTRLATFTGGTPSSNNARTCSGLPYRITTVSLSWKNFLTPAEVPWLLDHKVLNLLVLPGAVHIVMAIEACQNTADSTRTVLGYKFRDIFWHKPIVFSSELDHRDAISAFAGPSGDQEQHCNMEIVLGDYHCLR